MPHPITIASLLCAGLLFAAPPLQDKKKETPPKDTKAAKPAEDQPEPTEKVLIDFEKCALDKPPPDFTLVPSSQGAAGVWAVKEEGKKRVLAQTLADKTDFRFPVLIYDKLSAKNVSVSVKLKTVSGELDQAGGVIARFKDAKSYYLTRANALEGNVGLYRVVGGVRQQFADSKQKVTANEWHTLKLEITDTHFKVSYDDKLIIEADDPTHQEAGKAGVWTKSDSVTYFDDLEIASFDEE